MHIPVNKSIKFAVATEYQIFNLISLIEVEPVPPSTAGEVLT